MNEKYFKMSDSDKIGEKQLAKIIVLRGTVLFLGQVKGKCRLNLDKWKRIGPQTITQKGEEISNEIIMQDIDLQRKKGCG